MVERRLMRKEYLPWVEADAVDPLNPRPYMPDDSRPKRWDVYIQDMQKHWRQVLARQAWITRATCTTRRRRQRVSRCQSEVCWLQIPQDVRDAH